MTYSSSIPSQQLPATIPVSPPASLSPLPAPLSQKVDETAQSELEQLKLKMQNLELENSRLKEQNFKLNQDCIGLQTTLSTQAASLPAASAMTTPPPPASTSSTPGLASRALSWFAQAVSLPASTKTPVYPAAISSSSGGMIAPASEDPMQCVADKLSPLNTDDLTKLRKELFEVLVTKLPVPPHPWVGQELVTKFQKALDSNPTATLIQTFENKSSPNRWFGQTIQLHLIRASNGGTQADVIDVIKFYIHITRVNSAKGHFVGAIYYPNLPYLICPLLLKLGFTANDLVRFGLSVE